MRILRGKGALLLLSLLTAVTLLCCVIFSANTAKSYAISNTSSTAVVSVDELTLPDYETRSDGRVFNANNLSVLYEYLTGVKGATLDTVSGKVSGTQAYGNSTIAKMLTSADIRTNVGTVSGTALDIVVSFGGYNWTVTSLTTDTNGDPIVTLWLASSTQTSKWQNYTVTTSTDYGTYPPNMYATSYIRVKALNAGGSYETSNAAITSSAQSSSSQWAKFTMSSVSGSLTSYIDTPSQVKYQEVESAPLTLSGFSYYEKNEAYGTPDSSKGSWYSSASTNNYATRATAGQYYDNWKNDYLWLPSLSETGGYGSNLGIWNTSTNQRANSATSWLRSGNNGTPYYVNGLADTGSRAYSVASTAYAVRPALHLNLSAAETDSAVALDNPSDLTTEYNGTVQTVGTVAPAWYDSAKYNEFVTATYTPAEPTDAGTYTVTLSLDATKAVAWSDGTTADKTVTLTINKKSIGLKPLILNDDGSVSQLEAVDGAVYDRDTANGTAPQLGVKYFDSGGAELAASELSSSGLPYKAGTYTAKAYIVNADDCNYQLDKEYESSFTIDSRQITLSAGEDELSWEKDDATGEIVITVTGTFVEGISPQITLYYMDGEEKKTIGTYTVGEGEEITIPYSSISVSDYTKTYALQAELIEDGIYSLVSFSKAFEITLSKVSSAMTWVYTRGAGATQTAVENAGVSESFTGNFVYDGKPIKFNIAQTASLANKIEAVSVTGETQTDAGTSYSTVIKLKCLTGYVFDDGLTEKTYTLTWDIAKADYDMTGVCWGYNNGTTDVPYSDTALSYTGETQTIQLINLPDGLSVLNSSYGNNSKLNAGEYTATVKAFQNSKATNYNTPSVEGYTNFVWKINKVRIDLLWGEEETEAGGDTYFLPVISNNADKVTYAYYTADDFDETTGTGGMALTLDGVVYEDGVIKTYYVVVSLSDRYSATNYELVGDLYQSFTVGNDKDPVTVIVTVGGATYDGAQHGATVNVETGDLSAKDIKIEYYLTSEGAGSKTESAPVNAGEYTAVISVAGVSADYYYIKGQKSYPFTIAKADYDLSGLKFDGATAVYDGTAHTVAVTGLPEGVTVVYTDGGENVGAYAQTNAGTYTVTAIFTVDPNYNEISEMTATLTIAKADYDLSGLKFDDVTAVYDGEAHTVAVTGLPDGVTVVYTDGGENVDAYAQTEAGTYTVTAIFTVDSNYNEIEPMTATLTIQVAAPVDPVTPDNPDNPDDGNPSGGGLPEGFPLWQVVVGGISLILTVVFLTKTITNAVRMKQYKRKTEKAASRVYSGVMSGGMLFGITDGIWTFVAVALACACVVTFIAMLATGHALAKARDEYEEEKARADMKMMMYMMGGKRANVVDDNGNFAEINDMEAMLTRVVSALLPAIQANQLPAGSGEELNQLREQQNKILKEQGELLQELKTLRGERNASSAAAAGADGKNADGLKTVEKIFVKENSEEVLRKLDRHEQQLRELLDREDDGFNDVVYPDDEEK